MITALRCVNYCPLFVFRKRGEEKQLKLDGREVIQKSFDMAFAGTTDFTQFRMKDIPELKYEIKLTAIG